MFGIFCNSITISTPAGLRTFLAASNPDFFFPVGYDSTGPLKLLYAAHGSTNGVFSTFVMPWSAWPHKSPDNDDICWLWLPSGNNSGILWPQTSLYRGRSTRSSVGTHAGTLCFARHLSIPIADGRPSFCSARGHGIRNARDHRGNLRNAGCRRGRVQWSAGPASGCGCYEEAVLRLAASPELRQSLGQAAQLTMARYTWERSALMLEKLFRRVIANEGKASA